MEQTFNNAKPISSFHKQIIFLVAYFLYSETKCQCHVFQVDKSCLHFTRDLPHYNTKKISDVTKSFVGRGVVTRQPL